MRNRKADYGRKGWRKAESRPKDHTEGVVDMRLRLTRKPIERTPIAVGSAVRFNGEQHWYTARAVGSDGRWVICTRPITAADREDFDDDGSSTVIYTVIDFDSGVRGPDNYYGLGYETPEEIADAMARFEEGRAEVSVRHDVYLDIAEVVGP